MGTSKLRESNLEYLRILSMIFIVAGHSVLHGGGGDASDSKWNFCFYNDTGVKNWCQYICFTVRIFFCDECNFDR